MSGHRFKTSDRRVATADEAAPVAQPVMAIAPEPEIETQEIEELPVEAVADVDVPILSDIDPRRWRLMDDSAPKDGTLIEVLADPDQPETEAVPVKYRITRRRDAQRRQWMVIGFWSNALTREELAFEPFQWRLPTGFLLPGMVV